MQIDSVLRLLERVNRAIMDYVKRVGYVDEKARVAREYFIDAVEALLDRKVENAERLLNKALEVIGGVAGREA